MAAGIAERSAPNELEATIAVPVDLRAARQLVVCQAATFRARVTRRSSAAVRCMFTGAAARRVRPSSLLDELDGVGRLECVLEHRDDLVVQVIVLQAASQVNVKKPQLRVSIVSDVLHRLARYPFPEHTSAPSGRSSS